MKIVTAAIVFTLIWTGTVSGAGTEYPFIDIGKTEKRDLAAKANMLKQGDPVKRVLELLGTPFSDDLMVRKDNNKVIGRSLKYYAVKLDKDFANEKHDQLVIIYLGPDDKVNMIFVRLNLE